MRARLAPLLFHLSEQLDSGRGVRTRQWILRRSLRKLLQDYRVARHTRAGAQEPPNRAAVLIVDRTLPDPQQDSGSHRIVAVAALLAELGFVVQILGLNDRRLATPAAVAGGNVPRSGSLTDRNVARLLANASTVWLSRPEVGARLLPAVEGLRSKRIWIYDTVDLHFKRLIREARVTGRNAPRSRARVLLRLEKCLIEQAAATVVVSNVEKRDVRELVPTARVGVIGNVHRSRGDKPPGREMRQGLLFVGNYAHSPNLDAALYLARELAPRLRRVDPQVSITLVGANSHRVSEALAESDGVELVGRLADLEEAMDRHLVFIAPLRFGAGVKGKIGYALSWGLPVISSTIGAEGMDLVDGENVLIADTPAEQVDAWLRLSSDPSLWKRLAVGGMRKARASESPEVVATELRSLLLDLRVLRPDDPAEGT